MFQGSEAVSTERHFCWDPADSIDTISDMVLNTSSRPSGKRHRARSSCVVKSRLGQGDFPGECRRTANSAQSVCSRRKPPSLVAGRQRRGLKQASDAICRGTFEGMTPGTGMAVRLGVMSIGLPL